VNSDICCEVNHGWYSNDEEEHEGQEEKGLKFFDQKVISFASFNHKLIRLNI
jgi:hypothetical protein